MDSLLERKYEEVASLLLMMPQEHSEAKLLGLTVREVGGWQNVALVRVWLKKPGDICAQCRFSGECETHVDCLHLVASRGKSRLDENANWNRLDGGFSRFPIGVRKIGHVAQTGRPVIVNLKEDRTWVAEPSWAVEEGIRSINAQPLSFRGKVLGVLGIFLRRELDQKSEGLQRMIADHLAMALSNAEAFQEIERLKSKLELENEYLRSELEETERYGDIVGSSDCLKQVVAKIDLVAPTDASVLIHGESGTGKELVAREIHRRSDRKGNPLVRVNCASIPASLFESELFGHAKGAFTGALRDRAGRFEAADGGTLFLDEIGEIPLELQSKLLRVLQEGQYERVGEDSTRTVNVRIIAATNRLLEDEVAEKRFREDLYYRLNVFPIVVPPLRERLEDVSLLARHFVGISSKRLKVETPSLPEEELSRLNNYDWPGNVRELQNVIERAIILSRRGRLRIELPQSELDSPQIDDGVVAMPDRVLTEEEIVDLQRENILKALRACEGKVYGPEGAASLLGLRASTLASRMKKLGIALKVNSGVLD